MSENIKSTFDRVCSGLQINNHLITNLNKIVTEFVNKNKQHIEFFGGNLTGVHVVRFLPADKDKWFNLILECDEEYLRENLHALPTVNPEFNVSSDPLNLSVAWIIHKLSRDPKMKYEDKRQGMINALLYLQFKFLTSRLARHFKYPADVEIAEATYAALSKKFAIKEHQTWLGVLKARAEDIISNTSIHYDAIHSMDDDHKVIVMINDIQGRIRDMLKNIYAVFLRIHSEGTRIATTSNTLEHDGVEVLKDKSKGLMVYTNYIKSVAGDPNSFIKSELVKIIENICPNAPPKQINVSLKYISKNYSGKPTDEINQLLEATMLHSFSYLSENKNTLSNNIDLPGILIRLRGIYTSSRSSDPELLELRELAEKIIRRAIETKTDSVVASVRTAVLLYIVARAYTMRYYSNITPTSIMAR